MWALTGNHVLRLTPDGRRVNALEVLQGSGLTSLAQGAGNPPALFVGSRDSGVSRSLDGGSSWERLPLDASVFSLAVSPADGRLYVGCEPSALHVSPDSGDSWKEAKTLKELPSAPTWSFPPRPWTSHVRTIAPHPTDAERLLVGIELGGVMLSEDGGASWRDHRPGAEPDAHQLRWHPTAGDRAYEAGGGGAAWSHDRGREWTGANDGLGDHRYCWAVTVDPASPDTWFVSAAPSARHAHHDGTAASARIFRWTGSGPWRPVMAGLPEDPLDSLVTDLHFSGDALWAGTRRGSLFSSPDLGDSWHERPVEGTTLHGLLVLVG